MSAMRYVTISICLLPLACASGGTASDAAARSQEASTAAQSAAPLVGFWDLVAVPPQPRPGLRMAFSVDSARGPSYFGRLSLYFAGNAGANADEWNPFAGTIGQDSSVEFNAGHRESGTPGILVLGLLQADTIRVQSLVIGRDTLSGRRRDWLLIKR
jgi:hypothetical protein